jgi:hypothetical protein
MELHYYKDLGSFVHGVNRLVQAGKGIDSEYAKQTVDGAFPAPDFFTCLSHHKKLNDKELKALIVRFLKNTLTYGSCYTVDISPTSLELVPCWREGSKTKKLRCQNLSKQLSDKILGKIKRILVNELREGKTS